MHEIASVAILLRSQIAPTNDKSRQIGPIRREGTLKLF
jgi:hypothetical protein